MPRYKFKWANLPVTLLKDLCRDLLDLPEDDGDRARAMQTAYGARPTVEFIRDAWPTLLESWLSSDGSARQRVVEALEQARSEKGTVKGSRAQMAYLRGLRNSKNLREIVWDEFIAVGEQYRENVSPPGKHVEEDSAASKPATARGQRAVGTAPGPDRQVRRREKKPEPEKSLEATLWQAADRLRSRVDAAEYKHVVLGLIFLKYVSDLFTTRREALQKLVDDRNSDYFMPTDEAKQAVLEDRDEYTSEGVFWVPDGHRWDDLRKAAKQTDIGERVDAAMDAIEKENPSLRGCCRSATRAVNSPRRCWAG